MKEFLKENGFTATEEQVIKVLKAANFDLEGRDLSELIKSEIENDDLTEGMENDNLYLWWCDGYTDNLAVEDVLYNITEDRFFTDSEYKKFMEQFDCE